MQGGCQDYFRQADSATAVVQAKPKERSLPEMSLTISDTYSSAISTSASAGTEAMPGPVGEVPETVKTILICETQPLTVEGIRAVLAASPDLRVIGVCENLAVCREMVRRQRPSIVLLDKALGMQVVMDWMQDLRVGEADAQRLAGNSPTDLRAAKYELRPVIWGVSMTEAEALRFLQAGAKGILRKSTSPVNMTNCFRTVAAGKNWMEDSVFREQPKDDRYPRSELTPREQQVMELVEHGLKNREIARELGIRPGTVKIHLKHIFEKTGVRGRYGLALTGLRQKGMLAVENRADATAVR